MQTDVSSAQRTTDGTLVAFGTRVKGLVITTTGVAGSIVLKDGGASGTARLTIVTHAVADVVDVMLPGEGIRFGTDVYLDLTDVASVTVFYG